jgi:hypothetical protein
MITAWGQLSTVTLTGVSTQIGITKITLTELVNTLNLYINTIIGPLFNVIHFLILARLNL